jgi:sec-independent protein translocase protein TatB
MFDIGFAELLIIGVVALIVIGPERLPDAVRTASAWLNRIRRGFNDIKQEVQQELHNDSVMRELRDLRETGDSLRRETQAFGADIRRGLEQPDAAGRDKLPAEVSAAPGTGDSQSSADPSQEPRDERIEPEENGHEPGQVSAEPEDNSFKAKDEPQ